jgi:uncharacterized membrane protein YhhN
LVSGSRFLFSHLTFPFLFSRDIQGASRAGGCVGVIDKCIFVSPSLILLIVACVSFFSFQDSLEYDVDRTVTIHGGATIIT